VQAKPKVYVETSVISYLVAPRNRRDLIVAANQELTNEWWATRREKFDLYVSAIVLAEVSRGNKELAAARVAVAGELALVAISDVATALANALVSGAGIPQPAYEDALHIAIAATGGLDYLLTWNCKHIANAVIIPYVNRVIRSFGYEPPLIYTPQQLLEE
jgi:predicted nucleic acid-binding protein